MLEISCGLAPALTVQMRKRKLEEGPRFPLASRLLKGIQRKIQIFFSSLLQPPGVFRNEGKINTLWGGSEKGGRVTGDKTFEDWLSPVLELHTHPQGRGFSLEQASRDSS